MGKPEETGALQGARVLVTAGPTRAYIDTLQYISSVSTGKAGTEIAEELLSRGAVVTFVHGKGSCVPDADRWNPDQLILVEVETLGDLLDTLREELRGGNQQVCIHTMAVPDFLPERLDGARMRNDRQSATLKLVRAPRVIEQVKNISPATVLVGFCHDFTASDANLVQGARELMDRSEAEIVVANDPSKARNGTHPAILCRREEDDLVTYKLEGKATIARELADILEIRLARSRPGAAPPRPRG